MKVVQISILAKVSGNVNADEVIGTRVTLKKMYSSSGDVLPFISARAVKYSIRQTFKEKGFDVDSFKEDPKAEEALRLGDSGNPIRYIDNDLFGYMVTLGRGKTARRRQGPVALSYFKALKDTPVKAEFAARFPRPWGMGKEENPVPFEVEVAEFIGKINCIMYENIGKFEELELKGEEELKKNLICEEKKGKKIFMLDEPTRKQRIQTFLQIFLTPSYVLPRRTNSLNMPEYIGALITLSNKGPLPIFQYLTYDFERNQVCVDSLSRLIEREEIKNSGAQFLFIDYTGGVETPKPAIAKVSVTDAIKAVTDFLA